jgi:hypothetical protein
MASPRNGFQAFFGYFFLAAQTHAKGADLNSKERFFDALQKSCFPIEVANRNFAIHLLLSPVEFFRCILNPDLISGGTTNKSSARFA